MRRVADEEREREVRKKRKRELADDKDGDQGKSGKAEGRQAVRRKLRSQVQDKNVLNGRLTSSLNRSGQVQQQLDFPQPHSAFRRASLPSVAICTYTAPKHMRAHLKQGASPTADRQPSGKFASYMSPYCTQTTTPTHTKSGTQTHTYQRQSARTHTDTYTNSSVNEAMMCCEGAWKS